MSAYSIESMLTLVAAAVLSNVSFEPRLAGARREDKAGWIYVHLQGNPHDVGYQDGTLLAPEIADALAAVKVDTQDSGKDWNWFRDTAYTLYWNKLDPEYQQEIQGIADGAHEKGDAIDFKDVLAMNGHIELQGYYLPWLNSHQTNLPIQSHAPMACSAFVATGSETADGKVVMGHNFWWDYFTGARWRVLEDVKPEHGHEFVMDTLPGLIHSGTDWAQNDDGILITETTISGFVGYDPNGIPEFQRMRKAAQYSSNLEDAVRIFETGNNGGYANTWLLADTKTNEIGKLELGLKNMVYNHTKDGAYYGSNFPEDPKLIQEEIKGYDASFPGNVCELRRQRWADLLSKSKGKVDVEMGKEFLSDTFNTQTGKSDGDGSALCGKGFPYSGAINAKVTTTELATHMQLWARMGVPDGTGFTPADFVQKFKITGPKAALWPNMPSEPWALFKAG